MADPGEVRSVSSTGAEKGTKLARYSLIPARPLKLLAEHFGRGAKKYDDHNWRRGYEWSKSFDALMRHAQAFWDGEDYDPDPEMEGSHHLTAVAWHAITLLEAYFAHPEFDDRFKPAPIEEEKTYPYESGDVIVLGPETFVSKDGKTLSYKGENYIPQPDPFTLTVSNPVGFDNWPEESKRRLRMLASMDQA
jgi:hypothetical protein